LHGVARLTIKLIHLGLRLRRVNLTLICLSVSIARALTLPIPINVLAGNTASIRSGIQKNMPNSRKPGGTLFVQM